MAVVAGGLNTEKFTECTQPGETGLPQRHPGGQDSKPGMGSRGWRGEAMLGPRIRLPRGGEGARKDLEEDTGEGLLTSGMMDGALESPGRESSTGPLPPSRKSP